MLLRTGYSGRTSAPASPLASVVALPIWVLRSTQLPSWSLAAVIALAGSSSGQSPAGHCQHGNHPANQCPHAKGGPLPRLAVARQQTRAHLQASHWGYPENFCEVPLGAYRSAALQTQVMNGWQDRLALYHFDFYPVQSPLAQKLNPKGSEVLAKLGPMLAEVGGELKIQPTGNNELDEARRVEVIERLTEQGINPPSEAIVLGVPQSRPLSGPEAPVIFGNMLNAVGAGSMGTSQPTGPVAIPVQPTSPNR